MIRFANTSTPLQPCLRSSGAPALGTPEALWRRLLCPPLCPAVLHQCCCRDFFLKLPPPAPLETGRAECRPREVRTVCRWLWGLPAALATEGAGEVAGRLGLVFRWRRGAPLSLLLSGLWAPVQSPCNSFNLPWILNNSVCLVPLTPSALLALPPWPIVIEPQTVRFTIPVGTWIIEGVF